MIVLFLFVAKADWNYTVGFRTIVLACISRTYPANRRAGADFCLKRFVSLTSGDNVGIMGKKGRYRVSFLLR
jgi:hypothetical protein